jgi:hypothetical protein
MAGIPQRSRVAFAGWAVAVAVGTAAFALNAVNLGGNAGITAPIGHDAAFTIWGLAYASVGGLIAARRPGNVVGWLLLAGGLAFAASSLAFEYSNHALAGRHGFGASFALWVAEAPSVIALVMIPLALLLFPDGRLPGRGWRPVAWLTAAAGACLFVGLGFAPGRMDSAVPVDNPFGVAGAGTPTLALQIAGWALTILGFAAAGRATVMRLRRSEAALRQQMKWMAYAAAVLGALWMQWTAMYLGPMNNRVVAGIEVIVLTAALAGVPVAMGIAILRYHLFDIDLIIRRTLVYALLVAALTGVYMTGVVGLSAALQAVAGGNGTLVVTLSTLAVAATFQPLRTRIQGAVDHRFYRQKYDAAATVDRFADHLRDQIDLGALNAELLAVVRTTVRPAHASVWIRPPDSG